MDRIEVTIQDIEEAVPVVQQVARRTPTIPLEGAEGEVWLKLENLQRLGVFKIRGAWNRISCLTQEERRRGVTTLSSGNHGRAVAWSARRLGLRCLIRVPEGADPQKLAAIRLEGAEVIPIPRSELVRVHEEETWRAWPETYLPPFAHPLMIAGNGTAGLEIAEDVPNAKTVLVPVGGGGPSAGGPVPGEGPPPRAGGGGGPPPGGARARTPP